MKSGGEIVLYQRDESTQLEVRVEQETVWLNRNQMAQLFGRDVKTIGKHINNALREELSPSVANFATVHGAHAKNAITDLGRIPVVANFATTATDGKTYQVEHYSLDVILSVGYRVKSAQGVLFRAWANQVLKDYLLRGYSLNRHLIALQERSDERFAQIEQRLDDQQQKVEFLVKAHTIPQENLFATGCVWDAYAYVCDLVRSAKSRIVLIDNFVDDRVLKILDKRSAGVAATVHTRYTEQFELDLAKHNGQCAPIERVQLPMHIHDRFLIVDDDVYLLGASVKDMGKGLCAITKVGFPADQVLGLVK